MKHSLFDAAASEPSACLAFSGNRLARLAEDRPADCLDRAYADGRARIYAFIDGAILLAGSEEAPRALFSRAEIDGLTPDWAKAVLLGHDDAGEPRLAVALRHDGGSQALPAGLFSVSLRALYMRGLLAGSGLGEAAHGAAMLNWSLGAQFCGACGGRTAAEAGGYRRRCSPETGGCGRQIFPRTDPVVIMLAVDEARERCLLGRSPHFVPGMYSCLAGFLEPGETMEDAVRRETHEEAGLTVGRVRYHASQPWPLPHTIMVGFYAEATSFKIDHDRDELEDCRWFTRTEAARLIERHEGELTTAADGTIANRLLRDWVGVS